MFARLGSGSACRSLYGGVVEWEKGFSHVDEIINEPEGVSKRAIAKKVCFDSLDFWVQNLRVLICVVKPDIGQNAFKDIPSTDGMKLSLKTSEMLRLRLENDLPGKHIMQLKTAMEEKDFHTFSEVTMRESN
jgi:diphosphomevalonate decarboxylase